MNLSTKYLGLELKNPIIVGASNLVTDIDTLKKLEAAGAAAIVYKSLFEEQMHLENLELDQTMGGVNERHAEMSSGLTDTFEVKELLFPMGIIETKDGSNLPIGTDKRVSYAEDVKLQKRLELAGANDDWTDMDDDSFDEIDDEAEHEANSVKDMLELMEQQKIDEYNKQL